MILSGALPPAGCKANGRNGLQVIQWFRDSAEVSVKGRHVGALLQSSRDQWRGFSLTFSTRLAQNFLLPRPEEIQASTPAEDHTIVTPRRTGHLLRSPQAVQSDTRPASVQHSSGLSDVCDYSTRLLLRGAVRDTI